MAGGTTGKHYFVLQSIVPDVAWVAEVVFRYLRRYVNHLHFDIILYKCVLNWDFIYIDVKFETL